MRKSAIEELRALEKRRLSLVEEVKAELLKRIRSNVSELRALGFDYDLVEGSRKEDGLGRRKRGAAPCKICGFQTHKPHDARAHRWQKPKAPFTDVELTEKGLRRIPED